MPATLQTIRNINDEVLQFLLTTVCFSKALLQIGTAAPNIAFGGVTYSIGGLVYSKGATVAAGIGWGTVGTSGLLLAAQLPSTTRLYCISLDASGNLRVTQGLPNDLNKPDVYPLTCPMGYLRVVTDNVTTFTPGTTALNAAGVTSTFVDTAFVPLVENPFDTTELATRVPYLANTPPMAGV
jgi:hypothetical protein